MSEKIDIKLIKTKEYIVKQSKYEVCGKLLIRSVILGPSGSGKTVLLQNMILNLYKDCFERIYMLSPSVNHDQTWEPVKSYIEDKLELHETDEERFYFDEYEPEELQKIIDNQKRLIEHMKKKNVKKLYSILIIIDDFADNPSFSRHSKLLHSLYTLFL